MATGGAYDPTMELRGRRVLITGASRGIGESLAHAFAGAGATVALVARSQDALEALAAELGGTAHAADLSDPTQVAALFPRVEDEAGPIDVLVNNAGIENPGGFIDAPEDEIRRVTQVNYLAPAELCRQAIPRMLRRGGGHIVNVSSMGGVNGGARRGDLRRIEGGAVPLYRRAAGRPARTVDRHHSGGAGADPHRYARAGLRLRANRQSVPAGLPAEVHGRRPPREGGPRDSQGRAEGPAARAAPQAGSFFPLLAEAPRRATEIMLTGIPHQAK